MISRRKFTRKFRPITKASVSCFLVFAFASFGAERERFTFAVLGDRTGSTVPGVYQAVWKAMAAEHPDFVVNVGDSIEGGNDGNAETEWHELNALRLPFQRYLLYFTPGNHDIWSPKSAAAYQKATGRPLHYSFDFRQAHFTILDNSQSEQLADAELHFLQSDLIAHASQPVKFVFFHRPSWILPVLLRNPDFPLHQLARKFGVQYVICGHIHQMLHFELDGITYLSMPSAGGHLRNPKTYNKGWFFGQTIVTVDGNKISMSIQELDAPFGRGRTTSPEDWGAAGLQEKSAQQVF